MAPTALQHRRTHNLLLISKLLNQRDAASPFILALDSLEQSARPLIVEFIKRARATKTQVIYVSFETFEKPRDVDSSVSAWSQGLPKWQAEVASLLNHEPSRKKLLVFDSLNPLAAEAPAKLAALLSSFINPITTLLAVYHTDIPLPATSATPDPYSPSPITLLRYLATTILTTQSLHHILARKAARERSHVEPNFGLAEGVEGVLQSLGANDVRGVVLEMEHRRKSGRGVREWYFLPACSLTTPAKSQEQIILLEDHPLYRKTEDTTGQQSMAEEDGAVTTFKLELTEKERRDRENVVLPYYDAQKGDGEGGRILYDMGSEDDFDEEEDEI